VDPLAHAIRFLRASKVPGERLWVDPHPFG